MKRVTWKLTLCKIDSRCEFTACLRKPKQGLRINLDGWDGEGDGRSYLKSRDITLPTKVCLVKAMVFPVVMYGCERWTVKKAEH